MTGHRRRSATGAVALGGLAGVVALLPLFLTGALAVQMYRDLSFGSAGLGLAVAMTRGAGAIASPFFGRLTDRLGATRSIRMGSILAAVTSLGIATADRWGLLVVWLMLSGCSQAWAQPAANRLLSGLVQPERLGLAFGAKQSAPPVAAMLAGLSIPVLAAAVGWRGTFVGAALLALTLAITAVPPKSGERVAQTPKARPRERQPRILYIFAITFGLGTALSSVLTTFYVDSAVQAGIDQDLAGTVLAIASFGTILVRVLSGAASDRFSQGHLRLCAALVLLGGLGIAALATNQPSLMIVGAIIGCCGAWGFNAVFWFALIRGYPGAPGRLTGRIAPGGLLGATVGPLLFGVGAERFGFSLAWGITAIAALVVASVMLLLARRMPPAFTVA